MNEYAGGGTPWLSLSHKNWSFLLAWVQGFALLELVRSGLREFDDEIPASGRRSGLVGEDVVSIGPGVG